MTDLEILMKDGCTKAEAEKHLQRGTVVYGDFEENFDKYMEEWKEAYDEEDVEKLKKMVETKGRETVADWSCVEAEGKTYYIEYCL